MSKLAPWEVEENNRWKTDDVQPEQTALSVTQDLSPGDRLLVFTATDVTDAPDSGDASPQIDAIIAEMDVQTAGELRRRTAEFNIFVDDYMRVKDAREEMERQLADISSTLFQGCELRHLPKRYEDISAELEENWTRRKISRSAIKRGIFLATELINAFPVYKYYLPLQEPLRLFECVRERLDPSQLSLVLGKIRRVLDDLYQDQGFKAMRCHACDRLVSLYIRARELEKAIEACDCGMTFEDASVRPPKRFAHRKKILSRELEKQKSAQNSWSVDYDAKFKRSVSRHDLCDAAFN
ncbi:MAG: hypothetical protein LBT23_03860 [Synergistaceae bacterium]|jgi:hypothetical protein|nr:hypothetical protein [Synergistaceae bacterium]